MQQAVDADASYCQSHAAGPVRLRPHIREQWFGDASEQARRGPGERRHFPGTGESGGFALEKRWPWSPVPRYARLPITKDG
jgi:hypothetical protein